MSDDVTTNTDPDPAPPAPTPPPADPPAAKPKARGKAAADAVPDAVEERDAATDDPMIAALLREREGYVQRDMVERIEAVDEQLRLRGYTDELPKRRRRGGSQQTR